MASTQTAGKNALLSGLKAQMEGAGVAVSATFVYLAGATTIVSVNAAAGSPAGGSMNLTGASGVGVATGTLSAVELRDRSGQVLRSYTIGAAASGRDILVTPSGSGVVASGSDIVISQTGVTFGVLTLLETPAT